MHKLIALFVLSLVVSSCSDVVRYPQKSKLHTHMGRATVALMSKDDDENIHRPFCTGTFIGHYSTGDVILTAAHCVEGRTESKDHLLGLSILYIIESEVVGLDEEPTAMHNAVSVKVDSDHDLALLQTVGDIPDHDTANIAMYSPPIGDTVYLTGQMHGLFYSYLEGTVSSYRNSVPGDDRKASYLQIDSHIFFGDSGAAVFDKNGNVVALAESINPKIPGLGWCVSLGDIKVFLYGHK